jgi:large subunit ribosomal protein L23
MVVSNKERLYEVIRRPIITEKTTSLSSNNQVVFEVSMDSEKAQIKEAIEFIFKVSVKNVKTLIQNGKVKVFRGKLGKRKKIKKAIVTLNEGQTIDLSAGV